LALERPRARGNPHIARESFRPSSEASGRPAGAGELFLSRRHMVNAMPHLYTIYSIFFSVFALFFIFKEKDVNLALNALQLTLLFHILSGNRNA
jgi:hypothetical protein